MKVSELVKQLEVIKSAHGDLEVNILDPQGDGDVVEIGGLSTLMGKDDKAIHVSICDPSMMDAFQDSE